MGPRKARAVNWDLSLPHRPLAYNPALLHILPPSLLRFPHRL
jgi:hypothetical protein